MHPRQVGETSTMGFPARSRECVLAAPQALLDVKKKADSCRETKVKVLLLSSLGKRKAELRVRAAFIRDLIKRSGLLLPVRLRKGSKTPKGRKCTEAFAHFLTSLARKNKLVGQVVLGGLLGSCSC